MIIFLLLYQKLTFSRMSTPQCHEINVMTFDTECHEICFVGRKTNVMTLLSWDLRNVTRFIFSGTGAWWRHRKRHGCVKNITGTTRYPQICTCKILFVRHQAFIVKPSEQTSWQTSLSRGITRTLRLWGEAGVKYIAGIIQQCYSSRI